MKKEEIINILKDNCQIILDYKDDTYTAVEFADFDKVADAILLLLSVGKSVKENEIPTFGNWLKDNNYTISNAYIYKDGQMCSFEKVKSKYRQEIANQL